MSKVDLSHLDYNINKVGEELKKIQDHVTGSTLPVDTLVTYKRKTIDLQETLQFLGSMRQYLAEKNKEQETSETQTSKIITM
jgi:hypothetical protein